MQRAAFGEKIKNSVLYPLSLIGLIQEGGQGSNWVDEPQVGERSVLHTRIWAVPVHRRYLIPRDLMRSPGSEQRWKKERSKDWVLGSQHEKIGEMRRLQWKKMSREQIQVQNLFQSKGK